jgi:hypothetical protein
MIKTGGIDMVANNALRYWGTKKCKEVVGFSTEEYPEKPCWELASEVGDFRSVFNICEDCIVFILKNGTTILSEEEIRSIGNREISCKFYSA